jgi:poly-beta-1,6-N-acetyl-D-glucosamine synthase
MKWAFWISAATLAYIYFGYPAWLWLRSRFKARPVKATDETPAISVVMVVRDEAAVLERKLQNLLTLDYPEECCEILVASDGSSDGTNEMLRKHESEPRVRVLLNDEKRGKAACLNDCVAQASGQIIVFTDARQKIEPDALRFLLAAFGDPQVGCASGELMLGTSDAGEAAGGVGLYWRIEKAVRELESNSGSVVGATGALYAVRRKLVVPVPPGTILDDVYIPMQVARQGFRVIFVPEARAWDVADQGSGREFSRKVRTLTGNYQLLQLAPWLLGGSNPLRFEFISHKLLRLVAPFALGLAFVSALLLHQTVYRIALALQLIFYGLSLAAMMKLARGPLARIADAAGTFVLLNSAALVAFVKFVTGRRAVWVR